MNNVRTIIKASAYLFFVAWYAYITFFLVGLEYTATYMFFIVVSAFSLLHGCIWSYVVSDEEGYIAASGDTRTGDFRIDTISKNATRLKWGLDSLALCCHEMKPVKRTEYWTNYEQLALVSSNNEIIFDCVDTDYFSGPDSVTFNKELSKLKYMMLWIAFPIEYKDELPTPL